MKNDKLSNAFLYKVQYNPCSDIWVDVFETSNIRSFEDLFTHLKKKHEGANFRCQIFFCGEYHTIEI